MAGIIEIEEDAVANKLGKVMQALEAGQVKQGLPALPSSAKGATKMDIQHTWKKTDFGAIGSVRAKKRGSGKH